MSPCSILDKVAEMSQEIGGEYILTRRGVPIIVIKFDSNKHSHSFCWMAKRHTWRGFYPYCRKGCYPVTDTQTKKDIGTDKELIDFVNKKRRT